MSILALNLKYYISSSLVCLSVCFVCASYNNLILLSGLRPDFSVPPPPVQASFIHKPPPPMKLEYCQGSNQPNFSNIKNTVGERRGNDYDPIESTMYSPTKPTSTPTKMEGQPLAASNFDTKGKLVRIEKVQNIYLMNYYGYLTGC